MYYYVLLPPTTYDHTRPHAAASYHELLDVQAGVAIGKQHCQFKHTCDVLCVSVCAHVCVHTRMCVPMCVHMSMNYAGGGGGSGGGVSGCVAECV